MSSVGLRDRTTVCGDIIIYVQELNPRKSASAGKRPLLLKSWSTVRDVKQALQQLLHIPIAKQRLFFHGQELGGRHRGEESGGMECGGQLRELNKYTHSLQDCGIIRDEETIFFAIAPPPSEDCVNAAWIRTYGQLEVPKKTARLLKQVRRCFELGTNAPKLTMEGFGGTYFMYDLRKRPLACFKPADEEPYTPNNPRGSELVANWGMVGKEAFQMRPGVKPGEGYLREVASFLMDHGGFAGVPTTMIVEAKHKGFHSLNGKTEPKVGSFQEFIRHDAIVEDLSPSLFTRKQVQKIALLDLRLLNSDRNGGNILVRKRHIHQPSTPKGQGGSSGGYDYELIPIDHGYCLPEAMCIDDPLNLCWFEWKQVKEPIESEVLAYIMALDAEKDADILRQQLGLREAALDNLRITTMLLKLGAKAGLTLHDMAQIVVRELSDVPSELEQIKDTAENLAMAVWRSSHCRHRPTGAGSRTASRLPPLMVPLMASTESTGTASTNTLSPGSEGPETDPEMTSRISARSSSSSLEDDVAEEQEPKEGSIASGSGGDPKKNSTGLAKPLKIRLDVIEREQQSGWIRGVTFNVKESMARPISPPSPAGFWHEPLEAMNARAEEQRVVPKQQQKPQQEREASVGITRKYSVCGVYPDPKEVVPQVRVVPMPSPYTFNPEETGLPLSDDEEREGASGGASAKGAEEATEEFAWFQHDLDEDEDNQSSSSFVPASSAASGVSLSSTSTSPMPDNLLDGASPPSSPTTPDMTISGLTGRHILATRSVSSGSPRVEPTLDMAVNSLSGFMPSSSYPSSNRRITRALSSPDFKKGSQLMQAHLEGQNIERSKSQAWNQKEKVARQSKEFRQCFFHYTNMLLTDLVQRKVKQKGLTLRAM